MTVEDLKKVVRASVVGVVAVAALGMGLAGCGSYNDHRGRGDAPVSGGIGDDSAAWCTNMPDQFSNVCGKCLHGFPGKAFTSTTHTDKAAPAVTVFDAPAGMCGATATPDVKVTTTATP